MFDKDDINNPLEQLKVEQALRSEMMKLEYRKKNNPSEINVLDYTIIEALNKQIPKKLIEQDDYSICPVCGACLSGLWGGSYCLDCGQKLDLEGLI